VRDSFSFPRGRTTFPPIRSRSLKLFNGGNPEELRKAGARISTSDARTPESRVRIPEPEARTPTPSAAMPNPEARTRKRKRERRNAEREGRIWSASAGSWSANTGSWSAKVQIAARISKPGTPTREPEARAAKLKCKRENLGSKRDVRESQLRPEPRTRRH
jgi:hypothetical protein